MGFIIKNLFTFIQKGDGHLKKIILNVISRSRICLFNLYIYIYIFITFSIISGECGALYYTSRLIVFVIGIVFIRKVYELLSLFDTIDDTEFSIKFNRYMNLVIS